jgi:phosphoribosylformylglycinamidine synthase
MEIWCNESQERYILSVKNDDLQLFKEICERERCPFAVVGTVTKDRNLVVLDELDNSHVVNIPMSVLFCSSKKGKRISKEFVGYKSIMCFNNYSLKEIVDRVLSLPTVASKSFLITIGDRSVTGLVSRDQMVGPWQVPISDVGVTCSSFMSKEGEAMAMGERPISALCNPSASARMALAEALLNIAAAKPRIETVRVSCNWMACPNFENDGSGLYYAVRSVSTLCKQLGVTIPVGKDSLSMSAKLDDGNLVVAPISLVVSAFSRIENVFHTLTPDLKRLKNGENTFLVFVDLAHGKQRLGGSCLAQVFNEIGDSVPDVESPEDILRFFKELNSTFEDNTVLAYHDKSDGGLFVTIAEMCFGGRIGAHCDLSHIASSTSVTEALFNEELGAVIQIRESDLLKIENLENYYILGKVGGYTIDISNNGLVESFDIFSLQRTWAETSYRIQSIRDNMDMALEEYDTLLDRNDPGLHFCLTYSHSFDVFEEKIIQCLSKPKVAILREQGINGAIEMAACFDRVGFQCVDVHMSDIISGDIQLDDFRGIVACGGFSFGDVLGAGIGWSKSVKMNQAVLSEFSRFFSRKETFALGICNGCQMLSNIVDGMPRFTRNKSDQFEARYSMVEIVESPATNVWFNGMVGSRLPIAVAHGEGRAVFESGTCNVAVRFVDNYGKVTERYPFNPNGSIKGSTGFSSEDGRILIMMPHPERVVRTSSMSWYPKNDQGVCEWGEGSDGFGDSPWIKMFQNVRLWTGA